MNFRIAYEPRPHLPTVNPPTQGNGVGKQDLRSNTGRKLQRQFFAMRQMVAIPANQSRVAGVFKQELQRWRFDVAVAKKTRWLCGRIYLERESLFFKNWSRHF
jgi:hypothetical protein